MRKKILIAITSLIIFKETSIGQVTQSALSPYTINVSSQFTGIIQHTVVPGSNGSSASVPTGSRIVWIEYGDGGFTSNNNTTRSLGSSVNTTDNNWVFLSSRLYDTARDQLRIATGLPTDFLYNRGGRQATQADNDAAILTGNNKILVTPNTYDIINRDTMSMAVTYKFTPQLSKTYYVVFNYNTNVFLQMAAGGDPTSTLNLLGFNNINNKYVKYARIFHNETYLQPANIPVGLLNYVANQIGNTFTEKIVLKIPTSGTSSLSERNIFFSLITKNGMADGTPTSINATLVERIDSSGAFAIIDKHTIADMTVRPAHDPNYIMQSPVCLQLPKTPRFFDYHLHFQNTGIGPADTAEITLNFTPGFDMNTFQIVHARFSDENYYSSNQQGITVTKNQTANTILLSMNLTGNRGLSNLLVGTNDVANPYISRETMGDIYFRMKSTAMVPYFLTAQAEIRFYSQQTTNWEQPVYTNTAISAYSDCCNCEVMDCGKK